MLQENKEVNERVAQSIEIVRKELMALPHAVKLVLEISRGAPVGVHFEYDSYQLAMADVLEVSCLAQCVLICSLYRVLYPGTNPYL